MIHRRIRSSTRNCNGKLVAKALGDKRAVILQNHGILTLGKGVESAVSSNISFENACEGQLRAEAAGTVKPIWHEVPLHTANQMKRNDPGAFGFQPLYDSILRKQPDFLE